MNSKNMNHQYSLFHNRQDNPSSRYQNVLRQDSDPFDLDRLEAWSNLEYFVARLAIRFVQDVLSSFVSEKMKETPEAFKMRQLAFGVGINKRYLDFTEQEKKEYKLKYRSLLEVDPKDKQYVAYDTILFAYPFGDLISSTGEIIIDEPQLKKLLVNAKEMVRPAVLKLWKPGYYEKIKSDRQELIDQIEPWEMTGEAAKQFFAPPKRGKYYSKQELVDKYLLLGQLPIYLREKAKEEEINQLFDIMIEDVKKLIQYNSTIAHSLCDPKNYGYNRSSFIRSKEQATLENVKLAYVQYFREKLLEAEKRRKAVVERIKEREAEENKKTKELSAIPVDQLTIEQLKNEQKQLKEKEDQNLWKAHAGAANWKPFAVQFPELSHRLAQINLELEHRQGRRLDESLSEYQPISTKTSKAKYKKNDFVEVVIVDDSSIKHKRGTIESIRTTGSKGFKEHEYLVKTKSGESLGWRNEADITKISSSQRNVLSIIKDEKNTKILQSLDKLRRKSDGTLAESIQVAAYAAKRDNQDYYVYRGQRYMMAFWQVTGKKEEAFNRINNQFDQPVYQVTPQLEIFEHQIEGSIEESQRKVAERQE